MGASRTGLGLVLAVALSACGSRGDTAAEPTAPAPFASTPSESESEMPGTTDETSPSLPEGGIPAGLLLPGQADGEAEPRTDLGRLYDYICLDPAEQWTLGSGFAEAQTVTFSGGTENGALTIEKLAAYPSAAHAARAFRGLLVQVELCGDGVNHVGVPTTWRATEPTGLVSADEAARLTYRTRGVIGTVITVVRVGRAVFYVDRRDEYAAGVPTDERTVADFVPTLAAAFG